MSQKVLYVVNLDATTSIPLEVAAELQKKLSDIKVVVYYKDSKFPPNPFTRELEMLNATSAISWSTLRRIYRLLRDFRPDVIHAHHSISALTFFMIASLFFPKIKLVKTEHNNHNFFKSYQNVINFLVLWLADTILCNSSNTAKSFSRLEKWVSNGKVEVVHNGVNIDFINQQEFAQDLAQKHNALDLLDGQAVVIGSVGRLVPQKNYQTLIKAFETAVPKVSHKPYLVIVGDGDDRKVLEKLIAQSPYRDQIILTGAISRDQVYAFLQRFDLFVMTSLWEGFCNTIVEAMAAKKAIVCSDIPTLKEVVQDSSLFSPTENPEAFADQIVKIVEDQGLRGRLSSRAYELAQQYSLAETADKYIHSY